MSWDAPFAPVVNVEGTLVPILSGEEHDAALIGQLAPDDQRIRGVCALIATRPRQVWWLRQDAEGWDVLAAQWAGQDVIKQIGDIPESADTYRYLINHDRGVYLDTLSLPATVWEIGGRQYHSRRHPLPLLTATGAGQGPPGSEGVVGTWSGQHLTVTDDIDQLDGIAPESFPGTEFARW